MNTFADPIEHLQAELERLDLLLHLQILRLRAAHQLSMDEFRGLYISDQQVDNLINQAAGQENTIPSIEELTERAEALRQENQERLGGDLPWQQVAQEFGLSPFEQDILLLGIAPEIDLKYETLYAYLNNDITRKWPTCDLALRLFASGPSQRIGLRRHLLPEGPLFANGILQPTQPAAERPSWLAGGFFLSPLVSRHLLGLSCLDPSHTPFMEERAASVSWEELPISADLRSTLRQVPNLFGSSRRQRPAPILVFEGHPGLGQDLAAGAVCKDLRLALLHIDLKATRSSQQPWSKVLQDLALEQRLRPTGLLFDQIEALFNEGGKPLPEGYQIGKQLAQFKGPVFFVSTPGAAWRELLNDRHCLTFHFGDPDFPERLRLWEKYVAQEECEVPQATLEALADRFVLTAGQIEGAVSTALDICHLKNDGSAVEALGEEVLFETARSQSDQSLGKLAVKVKTFHTWDDLVLPKVTLKRVKEVTAAINYRHVVYSQWGFEDRISEGKGLKVLFSGSSGTGKTMTAGVIARDLGLELYKIDLSGVVSKYIGETEKNLNRIFRAAQCSNAILFFDEADALFGKRSEVKDAHDRYANIEVGYLLQKMEEHEGVVILASNLSKNIDQAFSRRMHYVVEFPMPDESHREKLWRGMFPPKVPLGEDVDFPFLAQQFPIAGGDIRNVALDAAFLAAQDGQKVTMKQLAKAMVRQMIKQGKVPSPTDFKQYHALITGNDESE